ncbi:hypothetical protein V501_05082 [Pseudogymnoascus sp. VKM F-4519 (FW-2642)]|nr:hypothetical protein V501_05082 [Pseudogymnoascus sp. VKM F-4519 (FW-2642)]
MCFGLCNSAKGDISNGTDVDVPARKISSPLPQQNLDADGSEMSMMSGKPEKAEKAEKPKKKKWNDDEYGDSVSLALAAKTRARIKELYPDGIPPGEQDAISRTQMSSGPMGGPYGGGAMMGL